MTEFVAGIGTSFAEPRQAAQGAPIGVAPPARKPACAEGRARKSETRAETA